MEWETCMTMPPMHWNCTCIFWNMPPPLMSTLLPFGEGIFTPHFNSFKKCCMRKDDITVWWRVHLHGMSYGNKNIKKEFACLLLWCMQCLELKAKWQERFWMPTFIMARQNKQICMEIFWTIGHHKRKHEYNDGTQLQIGSIRMKHSVMLVLNIYTIWYHLCVNESINWLKFTFSKRVIQTYCGIQKCVGESTS